MLLHDELAKAVRSSSPDDFDSDAVERVVEQLAQQGMIAKTRLASGERVLVHISNFRPVKRVLDCIRTFAKLAPKIPSRLLMVGDAIKRHAVSIAPVPVHADRVVSRYENISIQVAEGWRP